MVTDITELAQILKAEGISSERMEWLKKLADMEYCANNPGHWLMSLKETNYLASLALQCLESNSTLVEALEKAQQRISRLESRRVKLPKAMSIEGGAYCSAHAHYDSDGDYYNRADVEEMLVAAGIKWEVE
jgi:hypothetical protein|nr:MAG TPA: hypothetical protein [Caudoviricetes sp.]